MDGPSIPSGNLYRIAKHLSGRSDFELDAPLVPPLKDRRRIAREPDGILPGPSVLRYRDSSGKVSMLSSR